MSEVRSKTQKRSLFFIAIVLFFLWTTTLLSHSPSSSPSPLKLPLRDGDQLQASRIFNLLPFPSSIRNPKIKGTSQEFSLIFRHQPSHFSKRKADGDSSVNISVSDDEGSTDDEVCDAHQGYGLLEAWKQKGVPYCNSQGRSRRMENVWPKPKPFYFFDMKDIRFDGKQYRVFAECPEGDQLNRLDLSHPYLKTITHRPRDNTTEDLGLECDSWLRGPTLVVWQTTHNFYHSVEALFGALQSLYMLGYTPSEARVLFAQSPSDLSHTTDVEFHRRLFGGLVNDLSHSSYFSSQQRQQEFNYCLEHAIFSLPANSGSVIPNSFWINTVCTNRTNLFVQDVSNYILSQILRTSTVHTSPSSKPLIVLTLRKSNTNTRKLGNEEDLRQGIEELLKDNPKLSLAVEFRAVDMAQLTIDQQFELMRDTCVLIGIHGAGLTHTLFMGRNGDPDESSSERGCGRELFSKGPSVIEISPHPAPGEVDNKVFNIFWNLAAWSRVHYTYSATLHNTGKDDRLIYQADIPHVLNALRSLLVLDE